MQLIYSIILGKQVELRFSFSLVMYARNKEEQEDLQICLAENNSFSNVCIQHELLIDHQNDPIILLLIDTSTIL